MATKKFDVTVGEDGTVKIPEEVLQRLDVKPGGDIRFEVDDHFYAVRLLQRREAERLDYLNWMHEEHCPAIEEMLAEYKESATRNWTIILLLEGMPMEKIAKDYEIPIEYIEDMASKLKIDLEKAKKSS